MKNLGNVLQFMCYDAPYGGNFIRSLIRLEEILNKEGIDMIYLFNTNISDKEWTKSLIKTGKKIYFLEDDYIKNIITVKKILIQHKIKFVHTHFTGFKYHFLFNIVKLIGNKSICIIRHLHSHYNPENIFVEIIKKLLAPISLYVGCSEFVAFQFQKKYNIAASKMVFVTNAVDFDRLNVFEKLERKKFLIDENAKIFLMFGYDYYIKGVDLALEAVSNLVEQNYNICLVISLSSNREYVESKVYEKFKLVPNWLKIVEAREDIAAYYNISDCFLSPSRSEGLSYSIIEAAFCGSMIIASDIPGNNSLDIKNVLKFPAQDVKILQSKIISVLSLTENQREELSKLQKEYVVKTYDLDLWANKIVELYRSLK